VRPELADRPAMARQGAAEGPSRDRNRDPDMPFVSRKAALSIIGQKSAICSAFP
jgi:hypothetical protein